MVLIRIYHTQIEACNSLLSLKDIKSTLGCMANEKAPGLDDFPFEVYKKLSDVVGLDILYVYQEAISIRSFGAIINQ